MIPTNATEGLGLATAPKFVIKVLPDGSKLRIYKEGVRTASRRARQDMAAIDRYNRTRTDVQLQADEIISAMRDKGINVDEREIFTNVARGNGAIYSKYLK